MATATKTAPARLNKKEMEKYRRTLLEKKNSLTQEIVKTRDAGEESTDESTQDIADKATSSYTKEFLFSLSDNERSLLMQIDAALARIDEGTFGSCTNCGTPMIEKRLAAVPWTPYCIGCMELAEKGRLAR